MSSKQNLLSPVDTKDLKDYAKADPAEQKKKARRELDAILEAMRASSRRRAQPLSGATQSENAAKKSKK